MVEGIFQEEAVVSDQPAPDHIMQVGLGFWAVIGIK